MVRGRILVPVLRECDDSGRCQTRRKRYHARSPRTRPCRHATIPGTPGLAMDSPGAPGPPGEVAPEDAVFERDPSLSARRSAGRAKSRHVALTFDDGPDHLTRCVSRSARRARCPRDVLRRWHSLRTRARAHARVRAPRASDREPRLRSHAFTKLRRAALDEQLRRTSGCSGRERTARPWVRPPYGDVDARVLAQLLASGNFIAMWSLDSHDYEIRDPASSLARCCAASRLGR